MADDTAIPDGYYAVPDPTDPEAMTYWRHTSTGRRPGLKPWPVKAMYGPVLYRKDVPPGLRTEQRRDWLQAWLRDVHHPWHAAIRESIATDPTRAGKRFADMSTRCCSCGRALTEEYSKVVGIGPECRQGLNAALLAQYVTPRVSRAHVQQLAHKETEDSGRALSDLFDHGNRAPGVVTPERAGRSLSDLFRPTNPERGTTS